MKVKYWLSILPVEICGIVRDKFSFYFRDELLDLVQKELGEATFLISAANYKGFRKRQYRKKSEKILADSGGFQFYFLTPGKKRKLMEVREDMFAFQMRIGDYILGGDVPSGKEMDEVQFREYVRLTQSNMELQFRLGGSDLGGKFINVLHGVSPRSMEIWYNAVKDFPHIGWALGAKGAGASGPIFQLLYLLEKGEIKEGSFIHFFALTGRRTLWQVLWVLKELGLLDKVVVSTDSSSFSLGRFGSLFYKEDIVRYEEIRQGREVVLYDGTVLRDVPKRLDNELSFKLTLTSVYWFIQFFRNVLEDFRSKQNEVMKAVRKDSVDVLVKWFKFGGVDTAWYKVKEKVSGRSRVRLLDRYQVEKGGYSGRRV